MTSSWVRSTPMNQGRHNSENSAAWQIRRVEQGGKWHAFLRSSLVFAASLVMSGTAHAVQSEMRQARAARFWFLRRPFGRAALAFWRSTTEAKGTVRGMRSFPKTEEQTSELQSLMRNSI